MGTNIPVERDSNRNTVKTLAFHMLLMAMENAYVAMLGLC